MAASEVLVEETREESIAKAKAAMRKIREEDHDQIGIHLLSEPEDYKKVVKIRESGVADRGKDGRREYAADTRDYLRLGEKAMAALNKERTPVFRRV